MISKLLSVLVVVCLGCQAEHADNTTDRETLASVQKQIAALTRQLEETRTALTAVQQQQQQQDRNWQRIADSVQQLQNKLDTFAQLQRSGVSVPPSEETLASDPGDVTLAEDASPTHAEPVTSAFADSPAEAPTLVLKTRVACTEVWRLLGQGTSSERVATVLGATHEAVQRCEQKIGRGGSG